MKLVLLRAYVCVSVHVGVGGSYIGMRSKFKVTTENNTVGYIGCES